jgi:hypothetical protein
LKESCYVDRGRGLYFQEGFKLFFENEDFLEQILRSFWVKIVHGEGGNRWGDVNDIAEMFSSFCENLFVNRDLIAAKKCLTHKGGDVIKVGLFAVRV